MAFIQNGAGKGFLGHQVKFAGFQAATSCDPICFLLTLPKRSVFHAVIKVRFGDIREVIIFSDSVPPPFPCSQHQTKHILHSVWEAHGPLCPSGNQA